MGLQEVSVRYVYYVIFHFSFSKNIIKSPASLTFQPEEAAFQLTMEDNNNMLI
jgi:hypothetical protein